MITGDSYIGSNRQHRLSDQVSANTDVHSIAVEIVSLDDHIAEMQTDTKYNPLCFGPFRVHFVHGLLELNRCRQRVARAGKFYERPITHQLDQPAPVSR